LKNIRIILTVLLFLLFVSVWSQCIANPLPTKYVSSTFYLDVYEDHKLTGEKIIAELLIANSDGRIVVSWEHIYITPFHNQKDVALKVQSFSSEDGTIKDFQLNKDNTATFKIVPGAYVLDPVSERNINVWLKLSKSGSVSDISASMVFYSNVVEKKIEKRWETSTRPYFELPYNRVF